FCSIGKASGEPRCPAKSGSNGVNRKSGAAAPALQDQVEFRTIPLPRLRFGVRALLRRFGLPRSLLTRWEVQPLARRRLPWLAPGCRIVARRPDAAKELGTKERHLECATITVTAGMRVCHCGPIGTVIGCGLKGLVNSQIVNS